MSLLAQDEAVPVTVLNEAGKSPFLLTADHAGRVIPRALGDLGVSEAERARHIAWDIGIAGVAWRLSALLDATAVVQTYSRLVIDCNRDPTVPSAFPVVSEATAIPGNEGLSAGQKAARVEEIFAPYHAAIAALVVARQPLYVALHSFTPVYLGQAREVQVAVLYNRNKRLSHALAEALRAEGGFVVGENEPYQVSDDSDYGVPVHAERHGLDYVELEIRQDLIADDSGQEDWAQRLARLLPRAASALEG